MSSGAVILGYRVPSGRETFATASQIQLAYRKAGYEAHAIDVSSHEIEAWVVSEDVITNPMQFKGVEFVGVVQPERSRASRAALAERQFARNEQSRQGSLEGYLSWTSRHIDDWWSAVPRGR